MALLLDGSGSITGLSAGGLPDSSITAADIADGAITSAKLDTTTSQLFGMRNRIINGDMRIDQRNAGASITPTVNTYSVDRWYCLVSAASKYSAQQVSDAPTGFVNSLKITSLSSYTVAATDTFYVRQTIEGFNIADLGWGSATAKTITLSFWVKSSLTGTFGGSLTNISWNRSYPFSYTISSANTWEQKTITITGDITGTWNTTNDVGVRVGFGLGVGSTYSGTAGAWAASEYESSTGATSLLATNGATWQITGVQLEVGSTATPFERRMYGQELALCQRYYQKYTSIAAGDGICFGGYGFPQSASIFRLPGSFPIPFRGSPTFSYSNLSVSTSGGTQSTVSSSAGMTANSTGFDLNLNVTVTTGTPYFLRATAGNNGYVDFSAEL